MTDDFFVDNLIDLPMSEFLDEAIKEPMVAVCLFIQRNDVAKGAGRLTADWDLAVLCRYLGQDHSTDDPLLPLEMSLRSL
ncbi:MAG: hypothetical protein ACR2PG_03370 [Hyphomicrobiaceae bacterium]